jgi:hypothetical protein
MRLDPALDLGGLDQSSVETSESRWDGRAGKQAG